MNLPSVDLKAIHNREGILSNPESAVIPTGKYQFSSLRNYILWYS